MNDTMLQQHNRF